MIEGGGLILAVSESVQLALIAALAPSVVNLVSAVVLWFKAHAAARLAAVAAKEATTAATEANKEAKIAVANAAVLGQQVVAAVTESTVGIKEMHNIINDQNRH